MSQNLACYLKVMMATIILLVGVTFVERLSEPRVKVHAEPARFDHIQIVSTGFLYRGQLGLLLLDRRNGNVWFAQRSNDESRRVPFDDPVFLFRAPFEILDQGPQERYPQR